MTETLEHPCACGRHLLPASQRGGPCPVDEATAAELPQLDTCGRCGSSLCPGVRLEPCVNVASTTYPPPHDGSRSRPVESYARHGNAEGWNMERLAQGVSGIHDADLIRLGVRAMLRVAGEDPDRAGLLDTPDRYLRAWVELTSQPGSPEQLLAVMFDDAGPADEMVVVGPVRFTSLCEHHLLPFTGTAFIAYIPDGGVVGLSKLPRLLEHYARRPQVQERLTRQITDALDQHVPSKGSAAVLSAVHSCASMRGVRNEAPMTTSSLTGLFRTDERTRAELLALTRPR